MGLFDYQPRNDLLKWVLLNSNNLFGKAKETFCIDDAWLIFREKDGALWSYGEKIPFLFLDKEQAELAAEEVGEEWSAKKCRIVFD